MHGPENACSYGPQRAALADLADTFVQEMSTLRERASRALRTAPEAVRRLSPMGYGETAGASTRYSGTPPGSSPREPIVGRVLEGDANAARSRRNVLGRVASVH
ncbi:hypothetical protein [Streptomyces sp. NPDC060027]|uniref:hypothetical protein n=1 Tax=Streptomyces sp. NPDC060027 TaxID=3347040 RepID=UPI00368BDD46